MRRLAVVAAAVAGLGLFGTGLRGVAEVDGRLSEAADRPALQGVVDVRQETRARGDCPRREHREQAPSRDELRL